MLSKRRNVRPIENQKPNSALSWGQHHSLTSLPLHDGGNLGVRAGTQGPLQSFWTKNWCFSPFLVLRPLLATFLIFWVTNCDKGKRHVCLVILCLDGCQKNGNEKGDEILARCMHPLIIPRKKIRFDAYQSQQANRKNVGRQTRKWSEEVYFFFLGLSLWPEARFHLVGSQTTNLKSKMWVAHQICLFHRKRIMACFSLVLQQSSECNVFRRT